MYAGVPITVPAPVSPSVADAGRETDEESSAASPIEVVRAGSWTYEEPSPSIARASPKSMTTVRPSVVTMTLVGLKSR